MEFTLTLVASNIPLSPAQIAITSRFLDSHGILTTTDPEWLSPHKAADLGISQSLTIDQIKDLRQIHEEHRVDVFCAPSQNRRKQILLADMDSTIVTSETLDEMAEEAGIKDKISKITERAMRGELDFHDALRDRVSLLTGLSADCLTRTLNKTAISKGAEKFVRTMSQHNAHCVLVSGGFTFFTNAIAKNIGFHAHHGNVLGIEDNKLTGHVQGPILDKDAKLNYLKLYCEEHGIDITQSLTIGDGANDLPMLEAAGLGIGYHPKPLLEDNLLNCIRHGDLTAALYAQGYKETDFSK